MYDDFLGIEMKNSTFRCARCDKMDGTATESEFKPFKMCTKCKKVYYCSKTCQVEDWKARHKSLCA